MPRARKYEILKDTSDKKYTRSVHWKLPTIDKSY